MNYKNRRKDNKDVLAYFLDKHREQLHKEENKRREDLKKELSK